MRKIFLTAFVLILSDQIIKIWIKTNFILGEEYSDYEGWSADINFDSDINILDIVTIVNIILDN